MKKRMWVAAIAGLISVSMSMTAFAGGWKEDTAGWWYQNDDGSYAKDGWSWVEGKCYYFTPEGYCLINTQTPDGYTVDASGAWVVDGVVQTQEVPAQTPVLTEGTAVQIDNLVLTIPDDFSQILENDEARYFANTNRDVVIGATVTDLGGDDQQRKIVDQRAEDVLDYSILMLFGLPNSKSTKELLTGTWYCYDYEDASFLGISGSMRIYAKINGGKESMVLFAGGISKENADIIMRDNLR